MFMSFSIRKSNNIFGENIKGFSISDSKKSLSSERIISTLLNIALLKSGISFLSLKVPNSFLYFYRSLLARTFGTIKIFTLPCSAWTVSYPQSFMIQSSSPYLFQCGRRWCFWQNNVIGKLLRIRSIFSQKKINEIIYFWF